MNKIFGPKLGGYALQESGNFFMDNIIYFHNLVLCILFFILILVTWFLVTTLLYFGNPKLYQMINLGYNYSFNYGLYLLDFNLTVLSYYFIKINKIYSEEFLNFAANQLKNGQFFTKKNSLISFLIRVFGLFGKDIVYVYLPNKFIDYNLNNSIVSFKDFLVSKHVNYRYYFYSDVKLEFIWTLFPSVILLLLAIPSFGLLFSVEKVSAPELTVKVIGHQWYWEYQYMDYIQYNEIIENDLYKFIYKNKTEDNYIVESYMINDEDLSKGQFRLLEVDKKLVLPINSSIRLLITSDDVLHSWAVPALGVKVDACPGRINELVIKIRDLGIYYGQCSELCGWYHGFMPIVIQSLNPEDFKIWAVSSFLDIKYTNK
jgi:cytochrome c oxidase subunit 2